MNWVLDDGLHVTRRAYDCDQARYWWEMAGLSECDVEPGDWATVQAAIAKNWRIEPGDRYRRVVYVDGGKLVTYRAGLDMENLCQRLGLFDD